MAISRAQIPEQIDVFQEGGGAESDSSMKLLNELSKQFTPDYEASFERYQERLAPYAYQRPKMNIFDVASELGSGLLSTPNTGGNSLYVGVGLGFDRVSQRARKSKEENAKARQQIALQAAQLAMQDEQQAKDFIRDYGLKLIDANNKRGDLLTFEYMDESGKPIRRTVRDNAANDRLIEDLLINKKAVEVKTPGSVVNIDQGQNVTERDKAAIKSQIKQEEEYATEAEAAYGVIANVDYAMALAEELGPEGFGAVESLTFGLRKVMQDLGFGDLASIEKLGNQQVLNQLGMGFTMAIVSQTKGAISNKEMELFIQASPGLGSTYEGFVNQGKYLRRISSRDADFYEAYQVRASELEEKERAGEITPSGTYRELQKFRGEWQRENPLFSEEERKELQQIVDTKQGLAEGFDRDAYKKQFEVKRTELSTQKSNYSNQQNINPANKELLDLREKIENGTGGYANLTDEQKEELLNDIDTKLR